MSRGYELFVTLTLKKIVMDSITDKDVLNPMTYRIISALNIVAPYYIEYAKERRCPFCTKYIKSRCGLFNHITKSHKFEFKCLVNDIVNIINDINTTLKKHKLRLKKYDIYDRIDIIVQRIAQQHDTPLYLPYTLK